MTVKVAGNAATDRISGQIRQYNRRIDGEEPTPNQVAMVLHALADHTAIMSALEYRPDPTSPWPQATSVGRWLQDVGNDFEDLAIEIENGGGQ